MSRSEERTPEELTGLLPKFSAIDRATGSPQWLTLQCRVMLPDQETRAPGQNRTDPLDLPRPRSHQLSYEGMCLCVPLVGVEPTST
jgi:hypothetical protein